MSKPIVIPLNVPCSATSKSTLQTERLAQCIETALQMTLLDAPNIVILLDMAHSNTIHSGMTWSVDEISSLLLFCYSCIQRVLVRMDKLLVDVNVVLWPLCNYDPSERFYDWQWLIIEHPIVDGSTDSEHPIVDDSTDRRQPLDTATDDAQSTRILSCTVHYDLEQRWKQRFSQWHSLCEFDRQHTINHSLQYPHTNHSCWLDKSYDTVAFGGTFDHLHCGHKILLTMAALLFRKGLIVGLADALLLEDKQYKSLIQCYGVRRSCLISHLCLYRGDCVVDCINESQKQQEQQQMVCQVEGQQTNHQERVCPTEVSPQRSTHDKPVLMVQPLMDMFGPTVQIRDIDALVVSTESLSGGLKVNEKRRLMGMPELDIIAVKVLIASEDSEGQLKGSETAGPASQHHGQQEIHKASQHQRTHQQKQTDHSISCLADKISSTQIRQWLAQKTNSNPVH